MTTNNKITTWVNSPISDGDTFYLKNKPGKFSALGARGTLMIYSTAPKNDDRQTIEISDPNIYKKPEDWCGVNPFLAQTIRFNALAFEGICSIIGYNTRTKTWEDGGDMPYFNWNPFFIINGKRVHYQRGYVWSLQQKQALINTVYRNLECGRIILKINNLNLVQTMYKKGYTDFAARDIVDGKQRLSTLIEFVEDKFQDEHGNYFSELSNTAQRHFYRYSGMICGEMDEYSSNEQVCDAFLNNAVAGTPISQEHIDFMTKTKQELLNP